MTAAPGSVGKGASGSDFRVLVNKQCNQIATFDTVLPAIDDNDHLACHYGNNIKIICPAVILLLSTTIPTGRGRVVFSAGLPEVTFGTATVPELGQSFVCLLSFFSSFFWFNRAPHRQRQSRFLCWPTSSGSSRGTLASSRQPPSRTDYIRRCF